MKKILLIVVALFCITTVSAQSKFESSVKNAAQTVASQKWSAGLRVGSGVQGYAECFYSDKAYVEGRLGFQYVGFEIEPAYFEKARDRLEREKAQISLFD